jgi:hypothetical protein
MDGAKAVSLDFGDAAMEQSAEFARVRGQDAVCSRKRDAVAHGV